MALMTPLRLTLLAAVLPTVGFVSAIIYIYSRPLPDWALPPVEDVQVVLPDPTYMELDRPIQVGLYGGRIRVTLNLAFATRTEPLALLDLAAKVKEQENSILAGLTAAVLKEGEAIESSEGLANLLRTTLPDALKEVVNSSLGTPERPEPVDEVLILELSIQQG